MSIDTRHEPHSRIREQLPSRMTENDRQDLRIFVELA